MKNIYIIALLFAMSMVFVAPASAVKWTGYKVCLDPGHGGTDPGASGPSAPHEAELCLRAALALRTKLQSMGAPVGMTRTTNTTMSLTARRSYFLAQDPYIAISMHLNAFNKVAHGTETWYYWTTGNSLLLAQKVQAALVNELGRANRGVKQNGWTVITASSSIPSCLTEGLFVDNPTEWNMINTTSKAGFNDWVNGHLYGCYDRLKLLNANLDNPRNSTPPPVPSITVSPTSLSFTCASNATKTATFTVTGKDLGANISVTSNSSNFTVSTSSLAQAGGTVTVTFKPSAATTYSGVITVKSGTVSKTVSLTGTGTLPPSMAVSPASLSFTCASNATKTATFAVTGTSLSSSIAITSNSSNFTVSPSSLPVSGGTVTVTFKPSAATTYTGAITVKSGTISKTVSLTGTGTPPPSIAVSPASLSFTCATNETKAATFTVAGTSLTSTISVTSDHTLFTVSPSSLPTSGGTVTVTFNPSNATTYTGAITVKSGTISKTVSLTGTGTIPAAVGLSLVEKWNISQQKGNLTSKGWDASKVRNMAYGYNGKLYLIYDHAKVKVVTSQAGNGLYDLPNAGVSGGALTLCDVAHFNGKIIACNLTTGTTPLKVYVWDTDTSEPRVLLETSNLGGATRLGDCIGVTGTWNSGKIVFAHDDNTTTRIVSYAITNGVCSKTPTVINATTDGTNRLACTSSIRVQPDANGYWINGKFNALTRLDTSGKKSYEVSQSNAYGNGFSAFQYQGVSFAVLSTFNGSANYTGGCMELVNASQGWVNTEVVGVYPSAGLGTTPNTNCTGSCFASSDGNNVESWILSTGQGIAYYTHGYPVQYAGEVITDIQTPDSDNLFSLSVADNLLTVRGMEVSKIDIYSLTGHKVLSARGNNVPLQVARGVYVVIASDFDGNVKNGKIIVD